MRDGAGLEALRRLLREGQALVLTGAGVSVASGLPAYRDSEGRWVHRRPMQFREFAGSEGARRRYWARSFLGWPRFRGVAPNGAHQALAALEARGAVGTLVTQNVDGLHTRAGSRTVVDLHGRLDRVVCLDCGAASSRDVLQARMAGDNVAWAANQHVGAVERPDGDVEPASLAYDGFAVPACTACGGRLKPDVVFFGENVPSARVTTAFAALERARCLLVVGSSLMVFSGYRFARAAHRLGLPIAVVCRGRTRADELAAIKLEGDIAELLPCLAWR